MNPETLSTKEISSRKEFPFPVEERDIEYYQNLSSKAEKIQDPQGLESFLTENKDKNELVFMVPCDVKMIANVRKRVIDILLQKQTITEEDAGDLESLAGEILQDTRHSLEQGFKNPTFIIRLSNLDKPDEFSFEVVNNDRTRIKDWRLLHRAQDIVEQYGKIEGGTHVGTSVKNIRVRDLEGQAKYIEIRDKNGEKAYTSFVFSKDKLFLRSFIEWLKPQEKIWDDSLDQIVELYREFLREQEIPEKVITDKGYQLQQQLEKDRDLYNQLHDVIRRNLSRENSQKHSYYERLRKEYNRPPEPKSKPQPHRGRRLSKLLQK